MGAQEGLKIRDQLRVAEAAYWLSSAKYYSCIFIGVKRHKSVFFPFLNSSLKKKNKDF